MKKLLFLISLGFLLFACAPETTESELIDEQESPVVVNDGVFIHLSHGHEDPQRVLMALRMAEVMSEDKDVLVYFDIKAVHVVLKDAENITMEGDFPDSQGQLSNLIEKGIQLQVCPGCLKAAGKKPEDVMDGVGIADKEDFFNFTDGRILTLDY
jgi:predicted peroxiredoxin